MAYMIRRHIIIGHEIWVDEIVPKPAVAFLLLGDRKVTAGVQLARASQWTLWENIQMAVTPTWALSYHLQTYVLDLRVVFLENFSFASVARGFKNMLKNLRKGI